MACGYLILLVGVILFILNTIRLVLDVIGYVQYRNCNSDTINITFNSSWTCVHDSRQLMVLALDITGFIINILDVSMHNIIL